MTDEIRLVLPAEDDFRPVARLAAGGLALQLDLSYDELADVHVALDALLSLRDDAGDVAITFTAEDGTLRAAVGPLPADAFAGFEDDASELGLWRVLETVVSSFEVEERDDGVWVELAKQTATPAGA